jgi:hypothetical protein
VTCRRSVLVVGASVVVSPGCSWTVEVIVSWNDAVPTFTFKDPTILLHVTHTVAVQYFGVYDLQDGSARPDYKNPVWAFERAVGEPRKLAEVIYGRCPSSYTETKAAMPLLSSHIYGATVHGPGFTGGASFSIPNSAA